MIFHTTSKESKNDYMKLQDQVCTLSQSKRLEELGIEYDDAPILHYMIIGNEDYLWLVGHNDQTGDALESYPAFTVAELGEMLPEYVGEWFLEMYKDASNVKKKEWYLVRYVERDGIGGQEIKEGFNMQTEAQARAAMLIYLLENNLTTASECNKRLTP